jgi:hypothetical protein
MSFGNESGTDNEALIKGIVGHANSVHNCDVDYTRWSVTAIVPPSRSTSRTIFVNGSSVLGVQNRQLLILDVFNVRIYNHNYTLVPALIINHE